MHDYIYDIETFPNVFLLCVEHTLVPQRMSFEISPWRNQSPEIIRFCMYLESIGGRMVGFNNLGFDYPVVHRMLSTPGITAAQIYDHAMEIINTDFNDRFKHGVYADHRRVKQIDLFKINHFDNPAKATSLKTLEFNMRMNSVEDLPFKVGTMLDQAQAEVLRKYCQHDVIATKMFYRKNQSKIAFRESLERQYPGRDWLNFDDTKIGKEYFTIKLTDAGVQLYDYAKSGRTPRQTRRPYIDLNQCIFPWLAFDEPEFQRVLTWMRGQSINETKGVFTDVTATVGGLEYVFGLGGIHASVENTTIRATDDMLIESWDVSSMYPNIAISHGLYPAHLGASFNAVYRGLYAERQKYPKKSDPSEMIKLALNSSYGNSNNQFSFFYDPQFTMSITTNGQLMLCKLAEMLMRVPTVRVIMCNTDGLEYTIHPSHREQAASVCHEWEKLCKLNLEHASYSTMWISNVNNYIAQYTDGKVKRKGAFEHELMWHQNHSSLIVPKVAERVLVHGAPIRDTILAWPDKYDFMLRTKVPSTSSLTWEVAGQEPVNLQNNTRYLVSKTGGALIKTMPPLKKTPDKWRRIGIDTGWSVTVCNKIEDADGVQIDYDYYVREVEKLVLGLF